MNNRLHYFLVGSYVGMVVAVAGGFMLMPELFFGHPHRGISFWANYYPALIPFVTGLSLSAICLAAVAYLLPEYPDRMGIMRRLLWSLSIGLAAIVITPEQANFVLYWAHTLAAIYLFAIVGIGAGWIMMHAGKTRFDWFLLGCLFLGAFLSLFSASYIRILDYLAVGQLLALNGGALIIIRAVRRWSLQEAPTE